MLFDHRLRVERVIDHPGFARLLVDDGNDRTQVDLGSDARLLPVEERLGIRLLSGEELTVDKLLALFGRAEARDFVDFLAVADRYGLDRWLEEPLAALEADQAFPKAGGVLTDDLIETQISFKRLREDRRGTPPPPPLGVHALLRHLI